MGVSREWSVVELGCFADAALGLSIEVDVIYITISDTRISDTTSPPNTMCVCMCVNAAVGVCVCVGG